MRGGAIALSVTCAGSAAIIAYVHYDQKRELRRMQQSVLYDAEREAFRQRVHAERAMASAANADAADGSAASAPLPSAVSAPSSSAVSAPSSPATTAP
jgi:PET assembly of cytochrome c oxidase, mitochondrial